MRWSVRKRGGLYQILHGETWYDTETTWKWAVIYAQRYAVADLVMNDGRVR